MPQDTATGSIRLQVNTFCVHGGPGGRLSGIQGSVSCANPALLEVLPEFLSEQERADAIVEKCVLTFDSLPFIPPEPCERARAAVGRGGAKRGVAARGAAVAASPGRRRPHLHPSV